MTVTAKSSNINVIFLTPTGIFSQALHQETLSYPSSNPTSLHFLPSLLHLMAPSAMKGYLTKDNA